MIRKFELFESKEPFNPNIHEGDRIIITNGKHKNQTGVVIFVESPEDCGFIVNDVEVRMDYTEKEIGFKFSDIEKLDPIVNVTSEDPYGEEDYRNDPWETFRYIEYIRENELRLDGKHGFFMFLKLIDDMKMHFIKTNHFLNVGKYQYFFTTEAIRRKDEFMAYFKDSLSLKVTCSTALRIKDERLSFYFGVKGNKLEYGFHDDMKRDIYKTGIFDINTRYLRSLKSYKCLVLIENILKYSNISNLNLLQEIKSHFKGWYEGKGNVLILNENMIRKTLKREDIHDDAKESVALLQKYEKWCEKFKWCNKVYYYIDNEEENEVDFYIKIKPKKNVEEV